MDDYWIEWMRTLFENEPAFTDKAVAEMAKTKGEELGRSDYPALRTVNKYHHQHPSLPANLKEGYLYLRWPESMETGLLPWEASAAALELLDVRRKVDPFFRSVEAHSGKPLGSWGIRWGRVSVRLARWFWHISQAAPDLPAISGVSKFPLFIDIPGRYDLAVILAEWEARASVPQEGRDAVEVYLTQAPWRSRERALEYKVKVELGQIPGLTHQNLLDYEYGPDPNRDDLINEIFGTEDTDGEAQG